MSNHDHTQDEWIFTAICSSESIPHLHHFSTAYTSRNNNFDLDFSIAQMRTVVLMCGLPSVSKFGLLFTPLSRIPPMMNPEAEGLELVRASIDGMIDVPL
jgi:hypothetical protein